MGPSSHLLNSPSSKIAVIGAGISGMTCARKLHERCFDVTVFDKGRSVGGRMSTRRGDDFEFDHGCQFFTATDVRFVNEVERWKKLGIVGEWSGEFGALKLETFTAETDKNRRFVGIPQMNSICKHLADNLKVHSHIEVTSLTKKDSQWEVTAGEDAMGRYDVVILATPPKQSSALLADASEWYEEFSQLQMAPCWTVMVAFEFPTRLTMSGANVEESPLAWIGNNSSKPHRAEKYESWVLQATAVWSQAHLESQPAEIQEQMLAAFSNAIESSLPKVRYVNAHRWMYAFSVTSRHQPHFFDKERLLGLCGDWCNFPKVEGAYLSGLQLAVQVTQEIS